MQVVLANQRRKIGFTMTTETTPTYEQMGEAMAISLERIFDLMESGELVRSTAKANLPEWGVRSLEFVDKMVQANKALRMWREHGA